jgi:hypothetical protein
MQGDAIIEAKSYHGERGGGDKSEQANNYREILEKEMEGIVKMKNGSKIKRTFKKVKYMFSNSAAKKDWEGSLMQVLGDYLELWSPP